MDPRIIIPPVAAGMAAPAGHYSHAVCHGGLAFISGQLGVRPDGTHTAELPFEDQVRQTLMNLRLALESAGADLGSVVRVTAYIVGVEHWPRFNAVYASVMGPARPARTVVPVHELHHGYLLEVDAIAVRSHPGGVSVPS
ncbi:RidA family protein [Roseateles sp.]|uniref:RidA family protein n=1 Tax=Roseateles sp. TaxID=1971397 RepID=UPI0039EC2B1E